MKRINKKKFLIGAFVILSVAVLSNCAGRPNNVNYYDETIKSLECWDEVRWNQCEIERKMYDLFDKRRWQKCKEWICQTKINN